MTQMFYGAHNCVFNQPLYFDTSSVTAMNEMFSVHSSKQVSCS